MNNLMFEKFYASFQDSFKHDLVTWQERLLEKTKVIHPRILSEWEEAAQYLDDKLDKFFKKEDNEDNTSEELLEIAGIYFLLAFLVKLDNENPEEQEGDELESAEDDSVNLFEPHE